MVPTLSQKTREDWAPGSGGATKRSRGAGPPAPAAHGSASQENAYFFRGFFLLGCFSTPFSLINSRASLRLNG